MRLNRMRVAAVAGIAALSMVVAACGSSGSDSGNESGSESGGGSSQSSEPSTSQSSAESGDEGSSGSSQESTESGTGEGSGSGNGDAASATSAEDMGGMDALVAAAKKEGELNVIALPPDWANYGKIIKAFSDKYGIKVNSQNPNGSSAEEIQSAKTNKGTDKAPDVFDLGKAVAMSSLDLFAPYKVASWDDIPEANKGADGKWVNDYTGVMAIGYNASKYGEITKVDDLLDPKFKGTFALNGNPTQAGAAFTGVVMMALANGGSADDIAPGVEFFVKAKQAGTFIPLDPTPSTVSSGQTGVVIDWSYNQLGFANDVKKQGVEWKMYVPDNAAVGAYYTQAINADAPHPAAARLWEEFLFSPDAQNLYMAGGAQPILFDAMKKAGTLDEAAAKALPKTSSPIVQLTDAQSEKATDYLNKNWSKVES